MFRLQNQQHKIYIIKDMNQIESCELSLTIKQLKLSVKFPCKLTFLHGGKSLTSQISSSATNVFSVNKEVTIKQQKPKDYIEININLATDKGGNIMAGIIKINLKEANSSEGQIITLNLQKCLDPYASCTVHIKYVKINKSRVKTMVVVDDKRSRNIYDSRFETKSQAPFIEALKPRTRYNEAEQFMSKKVSFNDPSNYLKQKALSTVGFKPHKDTSFQRQEIGSRFKHLHRKNEEQDNKTVITGRWRQTQHILKSTMQSNEKSLKIQILKYKTKYEQSERNVQQKQKQIKMLKQQISELNRSLSEKTYLIQQINSKNNQIYKLQQLNKTLSRQYHEDRNKIIDLERQIQQQKNQLNNQILKMRQQYDKKQYQFQKIIHEKKQQIKQISQQHQYKINQIKKMKILIEDLERGIQMKGMEYQKILSNQKNQHHRTKTLLQNKTNQLSTMIEVLQIQNLDCKQEIKTYQEETHRLSNKLRHAEESLKQAEDLIMTQSAKKEKIIQQKRISQKNQEELSIKLKQMQKQYAIKEKQNSEIISQLTQINNMNKKKLTQLIQKNKGYTIRIQEFQNKSNIFVATEDKLKRNIENLQKQNKNLLESQKANSKNLKIKDDRILQLQRQLSDSQNKINLKQNLGKKDLQYKINQIEKLGLRIAELQKMHERQRQENESKRLQILKTENKMKMQEQTINRLNEQMTDIKQGYTRKQEQLHNYINELNEQIKNFQSKQIQYTKQLHNYEMQKINLRNEIARSQKNLENTNQKYDRLKKRQNEIENSLKLLTQQFEHKNEEIVNLQSDYKQLQNDYKHLQADKSKHEKITTIISEQKDNIKSDVGRLKKQIERRDQKQEQYLSQIKVLKQQITKYQLKINSQTKQYEKFKSNISDSVKSVMILKQSIQSVDTMGHSNLEISRSLNRSRVLKSQNNDMMLSLQQNKIGDIIQSFSRDSHQKITLLTEQVRKLKKQKESAEKQNSNLSLRLKDAQDQLSKTIKDMSYEIQNIVSRTNQDAEEYEEKISYLQKQIAKKDRSLNQMIAEIQQISNINQNQKSSHEINVSDLLSKIQSLKFKIVDYERKDESNAQIFINFQQKMSELEQYNQQLSAQVDLLNDQLHKKQRQISTKTQEYEQLMLEYQSLKKVKTELSIELLSTKQSLAVEKQNNYRLVNQIKSQQSKTTHLKSFQNQILKEKQSFLKKDFEKSQKIYVLEQRVQTIMIENAEKHEEISAKLKVINDQKENIKHLQAEMNTLQNVLSEFKVNYEKQKQKVKERQRKMAQKDVQIENVNSQLKKYTLKSQAQIKKLIEQNELIVEKYNKEKMQLNSKIQQLEALVKNLKDAEKRLTEYNITLQQQIFFEKQNNSLNSSKIQELKQHISQLEIQSSKLQTQISMLNEQVKQKQQNLFALSGKLYSSDNRLQTKQQEYKKRIQKVQLDWKYKLEQICEEYQQKLQIIERQKNYVRHGINDFNENIEKLQSDKATLKIQQQRQKQILQQKIKRIQQQKLAALIEKNKQIEKLREVIDDLENKIKRKEFQYKLIQDEKRKIDEKNREIKQQIQKNEEKKNQSLRLLQRQIDQLKRKQGQLKRFKQALRNSQWTTEREIKKNIQNSTKTLANLSIQSSKSQVLQVMKNLQSIVIKLALPNIDEI